MFKHNNCAHVLVHLQSCAHLLNLFAICVADLLSRRCIRTLPVERVGNSQANCVYLKCKTHVVSASRVFTHDLLGCQDSGLCGTLELAVSSCTLHWCSYTERIIGYRASRRE